jgi:hypothetical protein
VIVVGGALSTAASGQPLAEAFAAAGLQGVCYDRRGRGDSGDTAPYAPGRDQPKQAELAFQRENVRLVASGSTPTPVMLGTSIPPTILRGEPAAPVLVAACDRLAAALPGVELVVVPESHNHAVDPTGTVHEVLARLNERTGQAPCAYSRPAMARHPRSRSTSQHLATGGSALSEPGLQLGDTVERLVVFARSLDGAGSSP